MRLNDTLALIAQNVNKTIRVKTTFPTKDPNQLTLVLKLSSVPSAINFLNVSLELVVYASFDWSLVQASLILGYRSTVLLLLPAITRTHLTF